MNKLNEVYTLIEGKGDKKEIMQKVDRQELKRAHRFLLKKIESMQQDLKSA